MRNFLQIAYALLSILVMTSCNPKVVETVTTPSTKIDNVTQPGTGTLFTPDVTLIASKQGSWTTLKCGGSVTLGAGSSLSSSMQMRMERGKYIYISIRPMLGIEAARLVVEGSTVMIVDKLHRRYVKEDVSLLTGGVPVTVETLQDIFLGRIYILGDGTLSNSNRGKIKPQQGEGRGTLVPVDQYHGFNYIYNITTANQVASLEVAPVKTSSNLATDYNVNYANVKLTPAGNIAHRAAIKTAVKGRSLSLELEYDNLTWNQTLDADLSEPQGYQKIDAADLFNMF